MTVAISKDELTNLYIAQGLSDKEIADIKGISRSYVCRLRNGYAIRTTAHAFVTGRIGELYVLGELKERGFDATDMNLIDSKYIYDVLVDNSVRLEVKTARMTTDGAFKWQFANKGGLNLKVSEIRGLTNTGRTIKHYHKTCDFIVLVALDIDKAFTYIIPSDNPNIKGMQTISITSMENSKFEAYRENWDILRSGQSGK